MDFGEWELTEDELRAAFRRKGAANRLAFAVLRKYADSRGDLPKSVNHVPREAVDRIGAQLRIAPAKFYRRDWDRESIESYRWSIESERKTTPAQRRAEQAVGKRRLVTLVAGVLLLVLGGGTFFLALEADPPSPYQLSFGESGGSCEQGGELHIAVSDGAMLDCAPSAAGSGGGAPEPWTAGEASQIGSAAKGLGAGGLTAEERDMLQRSADKIAAGHGYRVNGTSPLYWLAFACAGAGALLLFVRTVRGG